VAAPQWADSLVAAKLATQPVGPGAGSMDNPPGMDTGLRTVPGHIAERDRGVVAMAWGNAFRLGVIQRPAARRPGFLENAQHQPGIIGNRV